MGLVGVRPSWRTWWGSSRSVRRPGGGPPGPSAVLVGVRPSSSIKLEQSAPSAGAVRPGGPGGSGGGPPGPPGSASDPHQDAGYCANPLDLLPFICRNGLAVPNKTHQEERMTILTPTEILVVSLVVFAVISFNCVLGCRKVLQENPDETAGMKALTIGLFGLLSVSGTFLLVLLGLGQHISF